MMYVSEFFKNNQGAVAASVVRQRGAALFTSLMVLVILTLLVLSAAQVTGLQERMAGVYRADHDAFQLAEDVLREGEQSILENPIICDNLARKELPPEWTTGAVDFNDPTAYQIIENLNNSAGDNPAIGLALGGTAKSGVDYVPGGEKCLAFRVSSVRPDNPADPTSRAIVQSIYIP